MQIWVFSRNNMQIWVFSHLNWHANLGFRIIIWGSFGFSAETISGNPIEREREKEGTVDRSEGWKPLPPLLPPMRLRVAADESPLAADVSESESESFFFSLFLFFQKPWEWVFVRVWKTESEIESLKVCALSAVGTRAVLELHELGYQLAF